MIKFLLLLYSFISWFLYNVHSFNLNSHNKHTKFFFSLYKPLSDFEAKKRSLILPFLGFCGALYASVELFIRIPQPLLYGSTPPPLVNVENDRDIVLIFPGANGPDDHTNLLKSKIVEDDAKSKLFRKVVVYDWLKWRGNFIRAAFDSQAVGSLICSNLVEDDKSLKNVHVIGISVGSFAADSCSETIKTKTGKEIKVRETFLDPFTSRGVFGYKWGSEHFGKFADIAEDYLNHDDPVPTTNDPLPFTYTIDVTDSKDRASFKPATGESTHAWPVEYLANQWHTDVDDKGSVVLPSVDHEPKGVVSIAP